MRTGPGVSPQGQLQECHPPSGKFRLILARPVLSDGLVQTSQVSLCRDAASFSSQRAIWDEGFVRI